MSLLLLLKSPINDVIIDVAKIQYAQLFDDIDVDDTINVNVNSYYYNIIPLDVSVNNTDICNIQSTHYDILVPSTTINNTNVININTTQYTQIFDNIACNNTTNVCISPIYYDEVISNIDVGNNDIININPTNYICSFNPIQVIIAHPVITTNVSYGGSYVNAHNKYNRWHNPVVYTPDEPIVKEKPKNKKIKIVITVNDVQFINEYLLLPKTGKCTVVSFGIINKVDVICHGINKTDNNINIINIVSTTPNVQFVEIKSTIPSISATAL